MHLSRSGRDGATATDFFYILLLIYASPHYFAKLYHIPDVFRLKMLYNVSFPTINNATFIILLISP
jgi:hypothetical protein